MNATIAKLADALARKTEDALSQLDALDREAADAFERAERAADHAVTARLARLERDLADRTRRFEARLADMFSSALDAATEALGECIDALAGGGVPDGKPGESIRWVPTPEALAEEAALAERGRAGDDLHADDLAPAAALPDADEAPPWDDEAEAGRAAEHLANRQKEFAEADQAGRRSAAVAAQLVAADAPAFGPADPDDDRPDDEPDGDDETAAIPHEKRGKGRSARYVPAELPEPGREYYRRVGRRWQPFVYRPND